MPWTTKTKISQDIARGRILTPDGNQILVGTTPDEVLIYQEAGTNWELKAKIEP